MDVVNLGWTLSTMGWTFSTGMDVVNSGMDVVNLAKPGFRVTEQAVENTAILLEDELRRCSKRAVVIYHMYDNNVYFAAQEDGSRSLPVKDPHDNTYHIPGSLEFADHTVMKKLVHMTVPLLRAAGEREKIVLSPLPQYIKKCCDSDEHLVNRSNKRKFIKKLGEAVGEMKDSIRDLIFGKKNQVFSGPIATATDCWGGQRGGSIDLPAR
jgi:hypothetical protein